MDDLFDDLSEWERLIAEMVLLLPNEEESLHAMPDDDLARLTQTLYALAASVEVVASERLPDIREPTCAEPAWTAPAWTAPAWTAPTCA